MELSLKSFLIVCPLVFLAGFVDSIGGGGGIISLPAYLFAGLPAHYAIATNKFSAAFGTMASTYRYVKSGCCDFRLAVPGITAALAGSAVGAIIAINASDQFLKTVMLIILPVIAFMVLKNRDMESSASVNLTESRQYSIVTVSSFIIGMYDGFYGPGTGTFLIIVYTTLVGMSPEKAAGNTKLTNLASNISSLIVFLTSGYIVIPLALAASVFSILGHYMGSGFAIREGKKIIRPIIILVIVLLFVKILFDL